MKLLKFSLVAILMTLVLTSCGGSSATDPEEDPNMPDGKVTIVTTVGGSQVDSRVIERKGDAFVPSNYELSGYYVDMHGSLNMIMVNETESDYSFGIDITLRLSELKAGTYNFGGEEDWNYGSYTNIDYKSDSYKTINTSLTITKVEHIAKAGTAGFYVLTGTIRMDLELYTEEDLSPNMTVDVEFQNYKIPKVVAEI